MTGFNGNRFFANTSTASGDWFTSEVYVSQRVSFAAFLDWQASGSATWEFLSDGSGSFVLTSFVRPLPLGCKYSHGSSDGTAEVTSVKMIFVLRDQTSAELTNWGRIKTLFVTN